MKNLIPVLLLASLFSFQASAAELTEYKRTYRYYLDPNRAEDILNGISLSPRFTKQEWLKKLGAKRNTSYKVATGDSLWVISGKMLGDPWLWRKLWQENPFLTNPHDISIGQILSYYRDELEPEPLYIPVIKLSPPGKGMGADLDSDSIVGRNVKNLIRLHFFLVDEERILGEVSGAFTTAEGVNGSEEIYLHLDDLDSVKVGDKFSVARYERDIYDTTSPLKPYIGRMLRSVADVKVVQIGDRLAKVEIEREFDVIRRGDKVMAAIEAVEMTALFNPPEELRLRLIAGEHVDVKMFSEGHLVMLNQGAEDGVKEGQIYRAVRDIDPRTERDTDVEPDFKGEVNIVLTAKHSSLAYIAKTKSPLLVGDTLVATQLFQNPPPRPRRETQTLILQ